MSEPPRRDPELDEALARFLDGEPEPTDGGRIAEAMRSDPAFAGEVGRLLMLDDFLRQDAMGDDRAFLEALELRLAAGREGGGFARKFSRRVRIGRRGGPGPRGWRVAAMLAACAAALIVNAALLWRRGAVDPPRPEPPRVAAGLSEKAGDDEAGDDSIGTEVAVLTRVVGARWAEGSPSPGEGSALDPGRLRLEAGYALIEFFSGASVILEGPSDLELISRDRAFCRRGKLQTHVPPNARGFTIGAPGLDAVDLGTEFTIKVDESGRGALNVLDGEVELHGTGDRPVTSGVRTLKTGQGANFGGDRGLLEVAANRDGFVDRSQLLQLEDANHVRRYRAWLAQSRTLQADPSTVLYYNFDGQSTWQRTLEDVGPRRDPSMDGAVVGCPWSEGRWPSKGALEFKRTSDRVRISVPGEFEELTFAAWVRIEGFNHWYCSLMLTDDWNRGEPHWQITDDGRLLLGISHQDNKGQDYESSRVLGPADLGRWVHLATAYDARKGRVIHYLDGKEVAQLTLKHSIPLRIGDADIGNWTVHDNKEHRPRSLNGRIDEFAIFGRVLDPEEVRRIYEVGKPNS